MSLDSNSILAREKEKGRLSSRQYLEVSHKDPVGLRASNQSLKYKENL